MDIVEAYRRNGFVLKNLNSTYIALIPKKDRLESFNDYRNISLCNLVYKIISKIIAIWIKHYLINFYLSKEQFRFLQNRLIHDAVGVSQEGPHTIKIEKIPTLILKMDLDKAYDRVHCVYLILVLL